MAEKLSFHRMSHVGVSLYRMWRKIYNPKVGVRGTVAPEFTGLEENH